MLSNNASRYYFVGDTLSHLPHRQRWLADWLSGRVFLSEVLLVLLLASIQTTIAVRLGREPRRSAAISILACDALLIAFAMFSPWFENTWDFFHGDVLAVAAVFDQIVPIAVDPYTGIMLPVYLGILVGNRLLLTAGQHVVSSTTGKYAAQSKRGPPSGS